MVADRMIEALAAPGPEPTMADRLSLYSRLIGAWDITDTHFDRAGAPRAVHRGEWLWGWVLDGRAVQDVIIGPPRDERRAGETPYEYGTAIRFYDQALDAWRVAVVSPVAGALINLVARAEGNDIIQEGGEPNGIRHRWVFTDITADTFRWLGYESYDDGQSWQYEEEIVGRRKPAVERDAPGSRGP